MCGIAGIIGGRAMASAPDGVVRKMLEGIRHRGPDDLGLHVADQSPAVLGMVRLSIIDLSAGNQPMHAEHGRFSFVFNGELYNHLALRSELEGLGVEFRTHSDTEVALNALVRYGIENALQRFDGMFAFCLYDSHQRAAWLARDPYGEKPLYYHQGSSSQRLAFCSELPPLLLLPEVSRRLDPHALKRYLAYQFNSGESSLVQDVKMLPPGSFMKVSLKGDRASFSISSYFSHEKFTLQHKDISSPGPMESQLRVKRIIEESVSSRLIADVPVGVFLSGGLDSSVIAYEASRIKGRISTFSIGFEDARFNESLYSRAVAKFIGSDHTEHVFTVDDFVGGFERLIRYQSQPFADAAAIPTALLSRYAREKVKVVLSGEGADEIFGGYDYYHNRFPMEGSDTDRGKVFYSGFPSVFDNEGLDRILRGFRSGPFDVASQDHQEFLREFGVDSPKDLTVAERFNLLLSYDLKHWLPGDLLAKTDTTTMSYSLECRAPYLNQALQREVFNLGMQIRAKNGIPKYLLKLLYAAHLPQTIVFRKKQGFGLPVADWLRIGKLSDAMKSSILDGALIKDGLMNRSHIEKLIQRHVSGGENFERALFSLMTLSRWMLEHGISA